MRIGREAARVVRSLFLHEQVLGGMKDVYVELALDRHVNDVVAI